MAGSAPGGSAGCGPCWGVPGAAEESGLAPAPSSELQGGKSLRATAGCMQRRQVSRLCALSQSACV